MLLSKPDRERGFKKERIIRVLLNHPKGNITKYRVAKLADVSEPWCREYTERLEEKDLLEDTKVINIEELYKEWKNIQIKPNKLTVALQKPMDLLENINLGYVLTTYQAENLKQGLLFSSTTDFYVREEEIEDWLQLVKEQGSLGGGNTRLRVTDKHVFYEQEEIEGYNIVSTPQLILDLLKEGGPCTEAAEKLINKFYGEEHG